MKFQPGQSGNPAGRKHGSQNKSTMLRERLAKRGATLLDKLIAQAEAGDVDALKFLVGRLLPVPRDAAVTLEADGETLRERGESILDSALCGRISPSQAADLLSALSQQARLVESTDLEGRIAALEARTKGTT